jgi:hypothetical protein
MPDVPLDPDVLPAEEHAQSSYDVVVRTVPAPPAPTLAQRAAALRARLPELARHPVVVGTAAATAGVATGIAATVVRRALGGAAHGPASVQINGYVVHHVHVIQHVVHHVAADRR